MNIYKFGGASVKDAAGVRNMLSIVNRNPEQLIVVVSAMGKTTNDMEIIMDAYFNHDFQSCMAKLAEVKKYHHLIVRELFGSENGSPRFTEQLAKLEEQLNIEPSMHYDYEYDRIVSFGELMSTAIIADFFEKQGQLNCKWVDIRMLLKTDSLYRDANVDWELTQQLMQKAFTFNSAGICLTQGFLGGTLSNMTTTLGREGSDYTAAIIGYAVNAQNVTIWKDVPGVLNADPRRYAGAQKIEELSYMEAIELTYYGAQVIHPKTLKPLQNKGIPLYVKSFVDPELPGTVIRSSKNSDNPLPVFIHKDNQMFVTVSPRDYSFIMDDRLIEVISLFRQYRIKMNLMQNSALNFSVCFDKNRSTEKLFEQLNSDFFVRYNSGVELITIRNYTPETIEEAAKGRIVINSQITRKVARFVLK